MPSFTVDSTKASKIPASSARRTLRWRVATTDDGGDTVQVSTRPDLDPGSTYKCGIPFQAGTKPEGESIIGHQGDVGDALYFRCASGVTSKIYWDADKVPLEPS